MNVVDSSCWLEMIEDSSVGIKIVPIVEDKGTLIVPTIVLYEVFKKTTAMKGFDYASGFLPAMLGGNVMR